MRGCVEHGIDAPKRVTITPDKKLVKCAICDLPWYEDEPETFQLEQQQQQRSSPVKPSPAKKKAQSPTLTAKSVIKEARRELKERNRRIRQLERELRAEKKTATELQRVVDAADGRRLAVVRDIQKSG